MAELADALDSGSSERKLVEVRVLSWAPLVYGHRQATGTCICLQFFGRGWLLACPGWIVGKHSPLVGTYLAYLSPDKVDIRPRHAVVIPLPHQSQCFSGMEERPENVDLPERNRKICEKRQYLLVHLGFPLLDEMAQPRNNLPAAQVGGIPGNATTP